MRQERITGLAPLQDMPRPELLVTVKPVRTADAVSPELNVTAVVPEGAEMTVAQTTVQFVGAVLRRVRLRPPKVMAAAYVPWVTVIVSPEEAVLMAAWMVCLGPCTPSQVWARPS
jgi:hypothetical protein